MRLNVQLVQGSFTSWKIGKLSVYAISIILVSYYISKYYILIFMLGSLLPFYFYIENMISSSIRDVLHSSTYFTAPPACLSCYWIIILLITATSCIILWNLYPKVDNSFISHYLYCLTVSLLIFLSGSSLKCFLLCMGIVNFKMIRRGFFGIIQRSFVICRGIIMIPFWMAYLQNKNINFVSECSYIVDDLFNVTRNRTLDSKFVFNLFDVFATKKNFSVLSYLLLKGILNLWLLQDIAFSFGDYKLNKRAVLNPVLDLTKCDYKCIICYEEQEDPVALRCGHIFCYKCIKRWISDHSTCPLCRTQFVDFKYIEFSDGNFPPSIFFLVF